MSDDEPSQLRRAHRNKRVRSVAASIDGGAVAVGVVPPLAAFSPTLVVVVPPWLVVAGLIIGLFLGGFLSGVVVSDRARFPRFHGGIVGVLTVLVVGLVVLADAVASGESVTLEITDIAGSEAWRTVAATLLAIGIGGFGSVVSASSSGS